MFQLACTHFRGDWIDQEAWWNRDHGEMATIYASERLSIHHSLRICRKYRERKLGLWTIERSFLIIEYFYCIWNHGIPWWHRTPPFTGRWDRLGWLMACFCASPDRLHPSKPYHLYPEVQAATIFIQASAKQLPNWLTHPTWVSFTFLHQKVRESLSNIHPVSSDLTGNPSRVPISSDTVLTGVSRVLCGRPLPVPSPALSAVTRCQALTSVRFGFLLFCFCCF